MRILACPLRADGTESLGTLGVISGDYQTVSNFKRYNCSHLTNIYGYVIYRNDGGGKFTELARIKGRRP